MTIEMYKDQGVTRFRVFKNGVLFACFSKAGFCKWLENRKAPTNGHFS